MWNTDVTLGHHVEHRGLMSRLTLLVLQCSRGDQLARGAHRRSWKVDFFGGGGSKRSWN